MNTDVPSGDAETAKGYAAKLLAETREELARADHKATTAFAAVGVMLAIVVSAAVDHARFDQVCWLARYGIALLALAQSWAVYQLGSAIYPRLGSPSPGRIEYFGDAVGVATGDEIRRLAGASAADPVGRDLRQFQILSGIVDTKYRRVQRGLVTSGAVALVAALGVVIALLRA